MPNWCDCDLNVAGENAKAFLDHVNTDESNFDFNRIVPQPPEVLASLDVPSADPLWYAWRVDNWGTKWNLSNDDVEMIAAAAIDRIDDHEAQLQFQTAWSPPTPVVLKASKLFPNTVFTLEYFECGMCFSGKFVAENGEIVEDISGNYYGNRGG